MSGPVAKEFEAANKEYAAQFNNGHLPLPPARKVIAITCMDARINPARVLGLKEGDAHVIRNAGGRAADALRSVIISQQLLGTREIVLIHHTNCGMLTFTEKDLRSKIRRDLGEDTESILFLPFKDLRNSIVEDVQLLKDSPLVLDVPITGYVHHLETGILKRVEF